MTDQPISDAEPTPEFNQSIIDVINAWESGDMPFAEGIARLTNLRQEAIAANHIANQGRAEHLLGYLQHYRGNLDSSIRHYRRARSLYNRAGNRVRMVTIDINQGENQRLKGDLEQALKLYRTAYATGVELGRKDSQTIAITNEGLALFALGEYADAIKALERGLELSDEWPDKTDRNYHPLLCEIYHGLANTYLQQGNLDIAWEYVLKGLDIAKIDGQPFTRGFANRTAGVVITALESVPDETFSSDPDYYFKQALAAFNEINAEAELARTIFAHAHSLAERGKRTTAARKLQQAMIIFTRLGMMQDAARAAEMQLSVT
jgi:tetratricopeptide (TPR) repeat protein